VKSLVRFLLIVVLICIASTAWSQEAAESDGLTIDEETADAEAEIERAPRDIRFGLIFAADNLLLDIDSYQGGVGAKTDFGGFALRGLLSLTLQNFQPGASDSFTEIELGLALEVPIFDGRVTPYWGVTGGGGYSLESNEADNGDKTTTTVITASLGPILGAVFFIFDPLSVFAEYGLIFRGSNARVKQDVGGTSSSDSTSSANVATELGNRGMLGIVIYLDRDVPWGDAEMEESTE
jgi:hypothetical protein